MILNGVNWKIVDININQKVEFSYVNVIGIIKKRTFAYLIIG